MRGVQNRGEEEVSEHDFGSESKKLARQLLYDIVFCDCEARA